MSDTLSRPGVAPAAAAAGALLGTAMDLAPFRLAGGTALAWHLGHRVSEDLDFFTFTPGTLAQAGREELAAGLRRLGPAAEVRVDERTVHGHVGGCRVSFFEVEGSWIDPPAPVREGFGLASVAELSAMKLVAVMTRSAKKDFYDLAEIAGRGISLAAMIESARRMYTGFDHALAHLRRSLVHFEDAESDPDPATLSGMTWPRAREAMRALAAELRR